MASLTTPGDAENNHGNTQMITRSTIKTKKNAVRETQTEKNNEKVIAKSRMKESSNTEIQKLRTNIEDRDRIIDRLKEERDQLRKENDSMRKRLKGVGITSNNQNAIASTDTVVGKRKHRVPPEPLTPPTLSQSPQTPTPVKTPAPHLGTKLDEDTPEKERELLIANNLKCITKAVQEGLREETYQQRERKRRANNIVIHGMKENTNTGDAVMIRNLMDTIEVTHSPKYFTRLGKTSTSTTNIRPLKIVMANAAEKKTFMKALPKLKDAGVYSRLRITDDYTIKDRKTISLWLNEVKKRNAREPGNCTWCIRGSPLTQLRLVKIEQTKKNATKNEAATITTTTNTKTISNSR